MALQQTINKIQKKDRQKHRREYFKCFDEKECEEGWLGGKEGGGRQKNV